MGGQGSEPEKWHRQLARRIHRHPGPGAHPGYRSDGASPGREVRQAGAAGPGLGCGFRRVPEGRAHRRQERRGGGQGPPGERGGDRRQGGPGQPGPDQGRRHRLAAHSPTQAPGGPRRGQGQCPVDGQCGQVRPGRGQPALRRPIHHGSRRGHPEQPGDQGRSPVHRARPEDGPRYRRQDQRQGRPQGGRQCPGAAPGG